MRRHPLRACLSLLGIAAGVAMIFAVQVVNESLSASVLEVEREIAGRADEQIVARSPAGMEQRLAGRVDRLAGVEAVAPVTQAHALVSARGRDAELTLFGVDDRLRGMEGPLARRGFAKRRSDERAIGIYLSSRMANRVGVRTGDAVLVRIRGRRTKVLVAGILAGKGLETLAQSRIAVAPLGLAQELAGSRGRIARLLVALSPGARAPVRDALRRAAGNGVDVQPIGRESELLAQASAIDRQAAALFSSVSLVVGMLLAFYAMLLSVMERRREIAIMRMVGAPPATLAVGLVLDALLIGVAGTLLGLATGWAVFIGVLDQTPTYIQSAFPLGGGPRVSAHAVVMAAAAGVGGVLAAAVYPILTLLRVPPISALRAEGLPGARSHVRGLRGSITVLGLVMMVAGAAIVLVAPEYGLPGVGLFVAGGPLMLPELVPPAVRYARARAVRLGPASQLGAAELAAIPARATAAAAVSTVTVIVLVMIGSLISNLESGNDRISGATFHDRELWVSVAGDENVYYTRPVSEHLLGRVAAVDGVRRAQPYRAAFLDWGERRIFVIAPTVTSENPLDTAEVVGGDRFEVGRRLREPETAALTWTLAADMGLARGESFRVPTPIGSRSLRMVGTITNYGWQPGALLLSPEAFARYWDSRDVTAVQAVLEPGVSPSEGKRRIVGALGPTTSLRVETAPEARARVSHIAGEGLSRLRRVSTIGVLAAILAVSAAMLTAISQRQRRLAALRAIGMSPPQVYRAMIAETSIVLFIGAALGLVVALPAHALTVEWVSRTSGYSLAFHVELGQMLVALGLTAAVALVAGSIPARWTTRTPIAPNLVYE